MRRPRMPPRAPESRWVTSMVQACSRRHRDQFPLVGPVRGFVCFSPFIKRTSSSSLPKGTNFESTGVVPSHSWVKLQRSGSHQRESSQGGRGPNVSNGPLQHSDWGTDFELKRCLLWKLWKFEVGT
eukprot:1603486-Rhodomonas_salina.3